jgi:hypothetical protein
MDIRDLEEANLFMAKAELAMLDAAATARNGAGQDKVVVEVAKALTLATENAGIEARVICYNIQHLKESMDLLAGERCAKFGGVWNRTERTLELPNGSSVVAMFQPKAKRTTP